MKNQVSRSPQVRTQVREDDILIPELCEFELLPHPSSQSSSDTPAAIITMLSLASRRAATFARSSPSIARKSWNSSSSSGRCGKVISSRVGRILFNPFSPPRGSGHPDLHPPLSSSLSPVNCHPQLRVLQRTQKVLKRVHINHACLYSILSIRPSFLHPYSSFSLRLMSTSSPPVRLSADLSEPSDFSSPDGPVLRQAKDAKGQSSSTLIDAPLVLAASGLEPGQDVTLSLSIDCPGEKLAFR